MKPLSHLGNKFSLMMLLLVMVATLLIVVLYEQTQYQSAMQQAASTLENDARLLGEQIRSQLEYLRRDAELISETPPIQGIIRSSLNGGVDLLDNSTLEMWRAVSGASSVR